jgi:hypothetical protein
MGLLMKCNPLAVAPRALAVAALMAISIPAFANDSVYTPTKGPGCVTTSTDINLGSWHCPGAGGYRAGFDDTGGTLGIGFSRGKINLGGTGWRPVGNGIGKLVEWRMAEGKPVGAIVRVWRTVADPTNGAEKTSEDLLVIKLAPKAACRIGAISVRLPNANETARRLVDSAGPDTPCLPEVET